MGSPWTCRIHSIEPTRHHLEVRDKRRACPKQRGGSAATGLTTEVAIANQWSLQSPFGEFEASSLSVLHEHVREHFVVREDRA
eukprot:469683-Pyramimonas_sp.AAC.1